MRLSFGGGARGGGSPPRMGSNALNALLGKAFSERSKDFPAAVRRESNGIFQLRLLPRKRSRYKNRLIKSRYSCNAEKMDAFSIISG